MVSIRSLAFGRPDLRFLNNFLTSAKLILNICTQDDTYPSSLTFIQTYRVISYHLKPCKLCSKTPSLNKLKNVGSKNQLLIRL